MASMLIGCDSVWPAGAPVADRPNRSLFTAPSIWMLLYRLLRPGDREGPGSALTAIGEKVRRRAREVFEAARHCRRFCSCSVETFAAGPVRDGLMTGLTSASTVMFSATFARASLKSSAIVSPSGTVMFCLLLRSEADSAAVTVYGPPTRTLEMKNRPLESVIAEILRSGRSMHCVDRDAWQHRVCVIHRDAANRPRRDVLGDCRSSDAERGV
jgi:hypothetical protein